MEKPNKLAQKYFIAGDFKKAKELFSKSDTPVEFAYCEIYCGDFNTAKNIIKNLEKESPLEEWLLSFSQMIEGNLKNKPSYLQIRNFYEIDLNNLFISQKQVYIENIISYIPKLAQINPEIFKLTARVFKNNGYDDYALNFLLESLNICFYDPETHFLMAEIYIKQNDKRLAIKHLRYACEKSEYYPAEKLLKTLV